MGQIKELLSKGRVTPLSHYITAGGFPLEIGEEPLIGEKIEAERLERVNELVIVLGGPTTGLSKDDFPPDGFKTPSDDSYQRVTPILASVEVDRDAPMGPEGLLRAMAATAFASYKQSKDPDSVLTIFASGGSGRQMRQTFDGSLINPLSLAEGESFDTSSNLIYVLEKLEKEYPDFYARVCSGDVPITIISSGVDISEVFVPYEKINSDRSSQSRRTIGGMSAFATRQMRKTLGGMSTFGTHIFRIMQMVEPLNRMGFKIRVLPAELIISDLGKEYGMDQSDLRKLLKLSNGRGIDEVVFSTTMAYSPRIVTMFLRKLAERRLEQRGQR